MPTLVIDLILAWHFVTSNYNDEPILAHPFDDGRSPPILNLKLYIDQELIFYKEPKVCQ